MVVPEHLNLEKGISLSSEEEESISSESYDLR